MEWALDPNPEFIYTHGDHTYQRTFYLEQADLGCVDFLKIVMFDWKGNWGSTKLKSSDDPLLNQLPYPRTLTLSFDDENRESNRQYVNLERQLILPNPNDPCEADQDICAYKTDHPDHGEYIYMEITVDPPIQGIWVTIEYEDPPFVKGTNLLPTNQVDFPGAPVADYSSGQNRDLTLRQHLELWGSHEPYGRYEGYICSNVILGDNYNYFDMWNGYDPATFDEYCDQAPYDVPADDPIRHHNPTFIPHFTSCHVPTFPQVPQTCFCEDAFNHTPYITLRTNIYGKSAVYFNTGGHGGDNFKFRAYTTSPWCDKPCLEDKPENVFTNWRRIYVEYAWMADRDGRIPNCPQNAEYLGDHQIGYFNYNGVGPDQFTHYKGVFDDCFIEIVPTSEVANTHYYLALDGSDEHDHMTLLVYLDGLYPLNYNEVLLIGVDHIEGQCLIVGGGGTVGATLLVPFNINKSAVAVGLFADYFLNVTGHYRIIDGINYDSRFYPTLNTAAHELGHQLLDDNCHTEVYGLMTAGSAQTAPIEVGGTTKVTARRSYFHSDSIIDLRKFCSL